MATLDELRERIKRARAQYERRDAINTPMARVERVAFGGEIVNAELSLLSALEKESAE